MNIQEFIYAYLFSVPMALMIIFTYDAIRFNGVWIVDMVSYGEYYIEIGMLGAWYGFLIMEIYKFMRK